MASWDAYLAMAGKGEDNLIVPQKKKLTPSQVSSMGATQSASVTKDPVTKDPNATGMQEAAKRKLKQKQTEDITIKQTSY